MVNKAYKPTMRFYCETSESGHFRAIKRIVAINLVREDQEVAKAFSGTVYVNLEEANRIYYIVNGDFFNQGTTSWQIGSTSGVDSALDLRFTTKDAGSHYQYSYSEHRITF
ncbi:hypothetical protein ABQD66_05060 [Enterococcus hirae]